MKKTIFVTAVLLSACAAEERLKSFYKIAHLSQSVVGISCPGNQGDPTVVGNVDGVLIVSCGTAAGR